MDNDSIPEQQPLLDAGRDAGYSIIAVGGGKGGIGKSLLAANLGICLAQSGQKVVLVDADLGGANLHTCLGIDLPGQTLSDFIQRRVESLQEVITETSIPGLSLISGAQDFLASANIKHTQKLRLLRKIRHLGTDVIILDLGSGTSFNVLDFFLTAQLGIVLIVPEPTSLENSYRFLRSAFYRLARRQEAQRRFQEIIQAALEPRNQYGIRTPYDLIRVVAEIDPERGRQYQAWLEGFRPLLVVNQVRAAADRELGPAVATASKKVLGIGLDYIGYVNYDDSVWQMVRNRLPLVLHQPQGNVAQRLWQLTREVQKRLAATSRPATIE